MRIRAAIDAFMADQETRNRESTVAGYQSFFGVLLRYLAPRRVKDLDQVTTALLREWRGSWTCAPSTAGIRLIKTKTFFGFAVREGWIEESPAARLRLPKADPPQPMPLTTNEMRALITATEDQPRERALLMLMRFSGVAIRDAVTLRRAAVEPDGSLTLRRAKTGELVMVQLPAVALAALNALPDPRREHFFWSGTSSPSTVAKYWRNRLNAVARNAGVADFHPHRLRHTFAAALLNSGVLMQDLSSLLGHSSVRITEKHYAAWDRHRRDRLAAIVNEAHQHDPILLEFSAKKAPATENHSTAGAEGLATTA